MLSFKSSALRIALENIDCDFATGDLQPELTKP